VTAEIRDNPDQSRYELDIDGQIVFATYRRDGATLAIHHVEAPPALRGSGAASKLMQGIVDMARTEGIKIRPLCSYASAWMRRHSEYGDLLV
jgi:predicted GNAT family acetyltransferase